MERLLHIPHASLEVPEWFYGGLLIGRQDFRRYNLEMSDVGVGELFREVPGERFAADYSRLFCDVERFRDDEKESMAKYGEGVIYTRLYDGTVFHEHGAEYADRVYAYYDDYHRRLDDAARRLLRKDGELLILDCHSFSDKMASHFFEPPFPDVCVGVEEGFCDRELVGRILSDVREKGYSCAVNYPYAGAIVPNAVMGGEVVGKVVSVMIEVNKRIYL